MQLQFQIVMKRNEVMDQIDQEYIVKYEDVSNYSNASIELKEK